MPPSRNQRASTADRRRRCLNLRIAGATWDTITRELKYSSKGAACKDFTRAMEAARNEARETATELRELELMRLDRVQAGFWAGAVAGDHRAGKVVLDVHDRRVRLLGLDAAQRTMDNAVDAWINHLDGGGDTGLSAEDAAALADVA